MKYTLHHYRPREGGGEEEEGWGARAEAARRIKHAQLNLRAIWKRL